MTGKQQKEATYFSEAQMKQLTDLFDGVYERIFDSMRSMRRNLWTLGEKVNSFGEHDMKNTNNQIGDRRPSMFITVISDGNALSTGNDFHYEDGKGNRYPYSGSDLADFPYDLLRK